MEKELVVLPSSQLGQFLISEGRADLVSNYLETNSYRSNEGETLPSTVRPNMIEKTCMERLQEIITRLGNEFGIKDGYKTVTDKSLNAEDFQQDRLWTSYLFLSFIFLMVLFAWTPWLGILVLIFLAVFFHFVEHAVAWHFERLLRNFLRASTSWISMADELLFSIKEQRLVIPGRKDERVLGIEENAVWQQLKRSTGLITSIIRNVQLNSRAILDVSEPVKMQKTPSAVQQVIKLQGIKNDIEHFLKQIRFHMMFLNNKRQYKINQRNEIFANGISSKQNSTCFRDRINNLESFLEVAVFVIRLNFLILPRVTAIFRKESEVLLRNLVLLLTEIEDFKFHVKNSVGDKLKKNASSLLWFCSQKIYDLFIFPATAFMTESTTVSKDNRRYYKEILKALSKANSHTGLALAINRSSSDLRQLGSEIVRGVEISAPLREKAKSKLQTFKQTLNHAIAATELAIQLLGEGEDRLDSIQNCILKLNVSSKLSPLESISVQEPMKLDLEIKAQRNAYHLFTAIGEHDQERYLQLSTNDHQSTLPAITQLREILKNEKRNPLDLVEGKKIILHQIQEAAGGSRDQPVVTSCIQSMDKNGIKDALGLWEEDLPEAHICLSDRQSSNTQLSVENKPMTNLGQLERALAQELNLVVSKGKKLQSSCNFSFGESSDSE